MALTLDESDESSKVCHVFHLYVQVFPENSHFFKETLFFCFPVLSWYIYSDFPQNKGQPQPDVVAWE